MVRVHFLEDTFFPTLNSCSVSLTMRGSRGTTLSWDRLQRPGLLRGARPLFLPIGLACSARQMAYPGGPFPGQQGTDFFGNAGGCVLKVFLFSQHNRSLVFLTKPFSYPSYTQRQPSYHSGISVTLCQGCPEQPSLPAVRLGMICDPQLSQWVTLNWEFVSGLSIPNCSGIIDIVSFPGVALRICLNLGS